MGTITITNLGKAYKQYPTRWSRLLARHSRVGGNPASQTSREADKTAFLTLRGNNLLSGFLEAPNLMQKIN